MLHAWEKYGLQAAEEEFVRKYKKGGRLAIRTNLSFPRIVKGKIEFLGMVRGKDSLPYIKFYTQLCVLAPEFIKPLAPGQKSAKSINPRIITEGKTDWKHLQSSLLKLKQQGLFTDIEVDFHKSDDEAGSAKIKSMCALYSQTLQSQLTIFIFDNDEQKITSEVSEKGKPYKPRGNNVFSFIIPVPSHRAATPDVCIELYYKDEDITRRDTQKRRLFLSNKFDRKSGKHSIM
jgi:RNA-directed DNA polymerase